MPLRRPCRRPRSPRPTWRPWRRLRPRLPSLTAPPAVPPGPGAAAPAGPKLTWGGLVDTYYMYLLQPRLRGELADVAHRSRFRRQLEQLHLSLAKLSLNAAMDPVSLQLDIGYGNTASVVNGTVAPECRSAIRSSSSRPTRTIALPGQPVDRLRSVQHHGRRRGHRGQPELDLLAVLAVRHHPRDSTPVCAPNYKINDMAHRPGHRGERCAQRRSGQQRLKDLRPVGGRSPLTRRPASSPPPTSAKSHAGRAAATNLTRYHHPVDVVAAQRSATSSA